MTIAIKFFPNDKGAPAGKLADAELFFESGPLAGLKLIGFGVWQRRDGASLNVTFPARSYSVNGERRSFALLRPFTDTEAQTAVRDRIIEAYLAYANSVETDPAAAYSHARPTFALA